MKPLALVTGHAGHGKTRWLLERVGELAPVLLAGEHQRVLAMAVMHGARRRLDAALAERHPLVPRTVTTIDSFALTLINRWRRALDVDRHFTMASDGDERPFGVGASFDEVLERAARLLESATVREFVGQSYPLVVIDEFQDCHGRKLSFVQALSRCSSLLLAGDEFQLLDAAIKGCPALEWAQSVEKDGQAEVVHLTVPRRTAQAPLLNATRALRDGVPVTGASVPFLSCPKEGPAAFRILERLVLGWYGPLWTETCALLSPSLDGWAQSVLRSLDKQAEKRSLKPIAWNRESSEDHECATLLSALGVEKPSERHLSWSGPPIRDGPLVTEAVKRVEYAVRVRGLTTITRGNVAYLARRMVHALRTRGQHRGQRTVTTVHGAKNREFDHVFLLWPFALPPDQEAQRRLLYNGLSRARQTAMVLMLGDASRAATDPVLRLLGLAEPAFQKRKAARHRRT